jgi:hypothetical protein
MPFTLQRDLLGDLLPGELDAVSDLLSQLQDGEAMAVPGTYGELLQILVQHVGEHGPDGGAVDVLRRIIRERDERQSLVEELKEEPKVAPNGPRRTIWSHLMDEALEPPHSPRRTDTMNKQPFYHKMNVLFTATADVSDVANSPEFLVALEKFLKRQFKKDLVKGSVEFDGPADAEPGDPADLM